MELLYRNVTPTYKGSQTQPTQRTGLLAELGSAIGGGSAKPTYRTIDGGSAQAPTSSRNWLQMFAVTPSYKTAAQCIVGSADPCAPSPDDGDGNADPACGCNDQPMQVVLL